MVCMNSAEGFALQCFHFMYARVVVGVGKGVLFREVSSVRGVLIERGSTVYTFLWCVLPCRVSGSCGRRTIS